MTQVAICNIALSHLGFGPIVTIDDATKHARHCKLLYDPARESVLRDHAWGFASKQLELVDYATLYLGYDCAYVYPTDCIAVREIQDASGEKSVTKFEIMVIADLSAKIIVTNEDDAFAKYTADIEVVTLFDPLFIEAFAWRLAADLVPPLRADEKVREQCLRIYKWFLAKASAGDSNETFFGPDCADNPYYSARG